MFIHGSLDDEKIVIGYDSSDIKSNTDHCLYLSKAWQKMYLGLKSINLPKKKTLGFLNFMDIHLANKTIRIFMRYLIYMIFIQIKFNLFSIIAFMVKQKMNKNSKKIKTKYIESIYAFLDNYAQRSNRETEHRTLISRLQLENRLSIIEI